MMVCSSDRDRESQRYAISDMLSKERMESLLDMVRYPIVILDAELAVAFANRPACALLDVDDSNVQGRDFRDLDLGLDHPERVVAVLKQAAAANSSDKVDGDFEFPSRLRRMVIRARPFNHWPGVDRAILLSCECASPIAEPDLPTVLAVDPILLLQEVQHRIGNSLQIIASTMLVKARQTKFRETRLELEDMRRRVMCVAAIHEHLGDVEESGLVELMPYLERLVDALSGSLVTDARRLSLTVSPVGSALPAGDVISIGLIVTELVTNAVKHAFIGAATGRIAISFEMAGPHWLLVVSDDGRGMDDRPRRAAGAGARIVQAIARKLDASVTYSRTIPHGTTAIVARGPIAAPGASAIAT
jgi:two-component sensor histidine kinase